MMRTKLILLAAIGSIPLLASPTWAQYRVGSDGRALDANNQVGSGGYNTGAIPDTQYNTYGGNQFGNQVITGNVTGGKGFHGNVPYTDQYNFRGTLGSSSFDSFISRSASSAVYTPPNYTTPFYGNNLAAPPPGGLTEQPFTGAFVPRNPSNLGTSINNSYTGLLNNDPRLNYGMIPSAQVPYGSISSATANLTPREIQTRIIAPQSSDLMAPGPIDPLTGLPSLTSASSLTGVRSLDLNNLADLNYLTNYSGMRDQLGQARIRLDPLVLQQMKNELTDPYKNTIDTATPTDPSNPRQVPGQGTNLAHPVPQPFETPINSSISTPVTSAMTQQPMVDLTVSGARLDTHLGAPPASVQSSQYAELQSRLNRYYTDRLQTDEDRNREFLAQLRAQEKAKPGAPGTPQVDYQRISQQLLGQPLTPPTPTRTLPSIPHPQPLKIRSLAQGVRAKGLSALLTKAEDLMKEGSFMSAVDQYNAAQQVAPNNALILLGRANAELGAGLYKRAEGDLRTALARDPVTTMAQFDLRAMLGQKRLENLVRDLKDAAQKEQKDAGLPLLLAYVAYNSGAQQQAGVYLDESEKRSGGKDELPKLLRAHWDLPGQAAAAPGGPAVTMALADILKQFEAGNVANATLANNELTGQFRRQVSIPGAQTPISAFKTTLPAGASNGPLARWLTEHAQGATLNLPTTPPARGH